MISFGQFAGHGSARLARRFAASGRSALHCVGAVALTAGLLIASALPVLAETKPPAADPAAKALTYAPLPAPTVPGINKLEAQPAPPLQAARTVLKLRALITDDGAPITQGLVWRIFKDTSDQGNDSRMQLVATSAGGDAEFRLDQGSYLVHAAYGRAGATTKVELTTPSRSETLVLNAGGVKLSALLSGDIAIPEDRLTFDVYAKDADSGGEKQALVIGAAANKIIRLNADTYQIVSHYGSVNAVVRAEIHVTPGKLTEATVYHKAAQMTFKLVADSGGEALTNVEWLIMSPGGDQVGESEGTFADMVLAEGDYTVVAHHQDKVYTRNFSVQTGNNREIEVQATNEAAKVQP